MTYQQWMAVKRQQIHDKRVAFYSTTLRIYEDIVKEELPALPSHLLLEY